MKRLTGGITLIFWEVDAPSPPIWVVPLFSDPASNGLVVPSATPPAIVQKLQQDIAGVLKQDDIKAKFAAMGVDPLGNTPAEFGRMIQVETKKWTDIVRQANIQPLE